MLKLKSQDCRAEALFFMPKEISLSCRSNRVALT